MQKKFLKNWELLIALFVFVLLIWGFLQQKPMMWMPWMHGRAVDK